MEGLLLDWARNILFFLVFLSVITHLLADHSYENTSAFCRNGIDLNNDQPL